MASHTKRQFVQLTREDVEQMKENVDSKSTKKATSTAVNAFREYLTTKGLDSDFEIMTPEELDSALGQFFVELRNCKGELYKKTTLQSYRQGIQRFINSIRDDIDIIHGSDFKKANVLFKAQTKLMKSEGKAKIEHHPPIAEDDITKLYDYVCASVSAESLQKKVFIDVMIHFGRRGRENLRTLKRTDFGMTTDASGDRYVYMTDERTKNHQDDSSGAEGQMYEVKDSDRCPVKSFMKYTRMLNPLCSSFFQQARDKPIEGIHFKNVPLGHNKIGQMMKSLSEEACLSKAYTNHSLRATTVHVLDAARIPSRHIMTVTGHKSESSLKTYSGQTDLNTKKIMSRKLSEKTSAKSSLLAVESAPNQSLLPLTHSQELALIEDIEQDPHMDVAFNEIQPLQIQSQQQFVANSVNFRDTRQSPFPVFNHCSHITVNCYMKPE